LHARITIAIAWLALFAALAAFVIGHLGPHSLSWMRNQVSTYAAQAPNGDWITAAMLLTALCLLCLGISISSRRALGADPLNQIVSMMLGVAASGLLLLACFKETAINMDQLRKMGFAAIRQQSFHDAGLLLFFYSSTAVLAISGVIVALRGPGWGRRMSAAIVALTGPIAYLALASSWPKYFGFVDINAGIKQRGAFLSLWIGALLLLTLVTKKDPSS